MNLSEMLRASGYAGAEADQAFADHLSETSAEVRRRVCALKKLQVDAVKIEADFYERVHQLEKEFQSRFDVVNVKRAEIVSGQREPTDGEADMPLLGSMEKEELESVEKKWNEKNPNSGVAGIPDFWLNVLRGASGINEMVQEQDVPILKHLTDITCSIDEEPKSYTLHFHFSQNEYFTNSVLDKFYEISTALMRSHPSITKAPLLSPSRELKSTGRMARMSPRRSSRRR